MVDKFQMPTEVPASAPPTERSTVEHNDPLPPATTFQQRFKSSAQRATQRRLDEQNQRLRKLQEKVTPGIARRREGLELPPAPLGPATVPPSPDGNGNAPRASAASPAPPPPALGLPTMGTVALRSPPPLIEPKAKMPSGDASHKNSVASPGARGKARAQAMVVDL